MRVTELDESSNAGSPAASGSGPLTVPVIEETVDVSKRPTDHGGYRITKHVDRRDELVDELLRSDKVDIERRAFNTAIADDAVPGIRQEGDTLVVPVIEEVLITVKRLILVEEVRITRTQETRRISERVPLRKESIEIERLAVDPSTREPS